MFTKMFQKYVCFDQNIMYINTTHFLFTSIVKSPNLNVIYQRIEIFLKKKFFFLIIFFF